ncbi:MAG: hypothetical protein Q8N30_00170 [Methylococcales bacterium]|nr:hypothetical protein [Methylococcales bacterium]
MPKWNAANAVILAWMPESSHRDVINVIPSVALDSSIHAGMTMLWLGY